MKTLFKGLGLYLGACVFYGLALWNVNKNCVVLNNELEELETTGDLVSYLFEKNLEEIKE